MTAGSVATTESPTHARALLPLVIPAIVVGAGSALMLLAASLVANLLTDVLWTRVPGAIGVDPAGPIWIMAMLTATGVAVGLVVLYAPGHAGPDPATVELASPPLPLLALPGLLLALILVLAGGVSLGPENPIIAVNTGLAVALGSRLFAKLDTRGWASLAFSGTLGAMFGTPVAAALALSEAITTDRRPYWDRLFGPLVAAAAGALTMNALGGESFALGLAPYGTPAPIDLLTGPAVGIASAVIAMVAVYAFPHAHRAFARLRSPFLALVVGGAILGVLGVIGGPITLFKGLDQIKELTDPAAAYSAGQLALFTGIKLVAVIVAGTCGFRGGRIFPAVFVAVALGMLVNALLPGIPLTIALSGSVIGVLVAVARSGWLALFLAALLIGDYDLLPLMVVIVLASWLVVTGRPAMVVARSEAMPEGRTA